MMKRFRVSSLEFRVGVAAMTVGLTAGKGEPDGLAGRFGR
jgi:hypothetical protein